MNITPTQFSNLYEIKNDRFEDQRGLFVKTFHNELFEKNGLQTDFKESYFSVSKKGVIRGMHLQLPPYDHTKLVYVVAGEILDVVVDLRKDSSTYGQYFSTILSSKKANSLYIGRGFAHGFLTLSESATVIYQTTTTYNADSDVGIRWNSFGFHWKQIQSPILSERDQKFPSLTEFGNV